MYFKQVYCITTECYVSKVPSLLWKGFRFSVLLYNSLLIIDVILCHYAVIFNHVLGSYVTLELHLCNFLFQQIISMVYVLVDTVMRKYFKYYTYLYRISTRISLVILKSAHIGHRYVGITIHLEVRCGLTIYVSTNSLENILKF